jgi:hypothetical protein
MTKRPSGDGRFVSFIGCHDAGSAPTGSAILGKEPHDVVEAEAAIAPLADAVEGKLAAIAKSLHSVDMQVEHVGDFRCGEHRPEFVDGH